MLVSRLVVVLELVLGNPRYNMQPFRNHML
jgi:hypothetical protein